MSNSKSKFFKYFKEYQWSNIFAMIRNNSRDPKICEEDFNERLVVITGATSGIGYYTARKFASKGADLMCINRSIEKSEKLKAEIESEFKVNCNYIIADLSSIDEIHDAAKQLLELDRIDVLIHNAGVYLTKQELTSDGLDKVLVVHYLSSFIINYILKEKLKSKEKSRIILVSSEGHRFAAWGLKVDDLNWKKRKYTGLRSYGSAKTAQLLSMIKFAKYFKDSGVTINAMHPGAVKTETGQDNGPLYRWFKKKFFDRTLKTADISAEAIYYLSVSDEINDVTGQFFNLTTEEIPAPPALDLETAEDIWEKSLKVSRLKESYEHEK